MVDSLWLRLEVDNAAGCRRVKRLLNIVRLGIPYPTKYFRHILVQT